MCVYRQFHGPGVPSANRDDQRYLALFCFLENEAVARLQSRVGKTKSSQMVLSKCIYPGLVENQIRPEFPDGGQHLLQLPKVLLITGSIWQSKIDRAGLFAKGKVVG